MDPVLTFALSDVQTDDTGRLTARVVPFGEPADYLGTPLQFQRGGLTLPDKPVPLTLDHSPSVRDRVGVLEAFQETDRGAFATFRFSDTPDAQAIRTLVQDGAITDVSVGVSGYTIDHSTEGAATMSGTLDHTALVATGRFSGSENPARVLSVHAQERPQTMETLETPEAPEAPTVAQMSALEESVASHAADVARLTEALEDLAAASSEDSGPVAEHSGMEVLGAMLMERLGAQRTADFAIADVVSDGTPPNDASGLTPNWYWQDGLQFNTDRRRPLFAAAGSAPWPEYGNNMQTAKVTQEVQVAAGTAQKAEVASRALHVVPVTFPAVFHKGAVDVALELLAQGAPDVSSVITRSFLRQYALSTNTDIEAKALAAATATGAILPTDTYANLVAALIDTSNLIEDATGVPGDRCAVGPSQWGQILGMMDGGDRRQFAITNPTNSDGSAGLTVRGVDVGGIFVFRDPQTTTGAIQFNQETLRRAELDPISVSALNVQKMGEDQGIFGGTVVATWDEGLYKYTV